MAQKTGGSSVCPQVSNTNAEGFTYDYDEYGNRWHQTLATGSGPGPQPSYTFDVNNHLPNNCGGGTSNFCYDDAGNLKYDGLGGNWSLDSEGKMFAYTGTSASATYTYDALGQRAERTVNGTTNDYVYDNQGNVNTKASGSFTGWNSSEFYLGGLHVNTYVNGSTYFSHNDHLGSERVETDPSGNTNSSATTNLPFGEWTSNAMQSELGFTGDLLDNLDGDVFHTPNRQYSETQGRWMRPDPAGLAAVNPMDPQTWNRYAYAGNNPTSYRDPTGLKRTLNWGPQGGGGFTGLYAMTGGNSYSTWANNFIQSQMAAGFAYNPLGVRVDGDTGELEQIVGWQSRNVMDLSGNTQSMMVPIWGDYNALEAATFQLGLAFNYTIWGVTGSVFAGMAVDSHGHVASYSGYGAGVGEGAGFSAGLQIAGSNGNSVCALGGPFNNFSGTAGVEGLAGTSDYFQGAGDAPGGVVQGGGVTIGVGGGGSASAQKTTTPNVNPIGSQNCVNGQIK